MNRRLLTLCLVVTLATAFFVVCFAFTTNTFFELPAGESCERLDAAMVSYETDQLNLFFNQMWVPVNLTTGVEINSGTISDWGLKTTVEAALWWYSNTYYFFSGPIQHRYNATSNTTDSFEDSYLTAVTDFFNDGIDAAAAVGPMAYYFKGCKYVSDSDFNVEMDLPTMGIPCDVDAAWQKYFGSDVMVVLKYDQLWLWDGVNMADGPYPFTNYYTLDSVTLCSDS